jgi:hypothetical protein
MPKEAQSVARVLASQIEIAASNERVWEILIDFPSYPDWNPFIKSIKGEPRKGAKLDVFLQPPGSKGITLHPELLSVAEGRELKWVGHLLGVPRIFDGEHHFLIQDTTPGRVTFVQQEAFGGVLVPFTGKLLDKTRQGFQLMNQALRQRAEGAGSVAGEV